MNSRLPQCPPPDVFNTDCTLYPGYFLNLIGFFLCPQVKQGLGGRVRLILSGAAPLASHVETFLRVVACAHVIQGYGMPNF